MAARRRAVCSHVSLTVLLAASLASGVARAGETWISVYVGLSIEQSSNVRVRMGEDDVIFHGVTWESRNLEWPIFYGLRVTHYFDAPASPGLVVDFVHDKAYAEASTPVPVSGTRGGKPVSGEESLSPTLQRFNMSHGTNLVTASVVVRPWTDDTLHVQPWAGVGVGFQVPHVEATNGHGNIGEYQVTGPTIQGLLGLRGPSEWVVAPQLEYRFARAHYGVTVPGGTLETTLLHHQLALGASVALGR